MVAHHHDTATDAEGGDGSWNGATQDTELVVDLDAQRLEGAFGRVSARTSRRGRDGRPEQLDEPRRVRERLGLPGLDDGPGDRPGELLLAVGAQDPGELGGRIAVEDVGGGGTLGVVHAHVEG